MQPEIAGLLTSVTDFAEVSSASRRAGTVPAASADVPLTSSPAFRSSTTHYISCAQNSAVPVSFSEGLPVQSSPVDLEDYYRKEEALHPTQIVFTDGVPLGFFERKPVTRALAFTTKTVTSRLVRPISKRLQSAPLSA